MDALLALQLHAIYICAAPILPFPLTYLTGATNNIDTIPVLSLSSFFFPYFELILPIRDFYSSF
jgi:hypothetical protein